MPEWLNKAAHIAIGAWVASGINNKSYSNSCWLAALTFLIYQTVQAWRKGDKAYDEIREFGIGVGTCLVAHRVLDYFVTEFWRMEVKGPWK